MTRREVCCTCNAPAVFVWIALTDEGRESRYGCERHHPDNAYPLIQPNQPKGESHAVRQ